MASRLTLAAVTDGSPAVLARSSAVVSSPHKAGRQVLCRTVGEPDFMPCTEALGKSGIRRCFVCPEKRRHKLYLARDHWHIIPPLYENSASTCPATGLGSESPVLTSICRFGLSNLGMGSEQNKMTKCCWHVMKYTFFRALMAIINVHFSAKCPSGQEGKTCCPDVSHSMPHIHSSNELILPRNGCKL